MKSVVAFVTFSIVTILITAIPNVNGQVCSAYSKFCLLV